MNNDIIKTIGKYALLLTVFYAIDIALGHYISFLTKNIEDFETKRLLLGLPAIMRYLLNIVTAIIISSDKKKLNITGKYSVLLTVFYRPVGVVLFLIYLIHKEIKSVSTHNIGS
ncbi:hypothetical protein ACFLSE_08715 [Bacteroidota bacterium]